MPVYVENPVVIQAKCQFKCKHVTDPIQWNLLNRGITHYEPVCRYQATITSKHWLFSREKLPKNKDEAHVRREKSVCDVPAKHCRFDQAQISLD